MREALTEALHWFEIHMLGPLLDGLALAIPLGIIGWLVFISWKCGGDTAMSLSALIGQCG